MVSEPVLVPSRLCSTTQSLADDGNGARGLHLKKRQNPSFMVWCTWSPLLVLRNRSPRTFNQNVTARSGHVLPKFEPSEHKIFKMSLSGRISQMQARSLPWTYTLCSRYILWKIKSFEEWNLIYWSVAGQHPQFLKLIFTIMAQMPFTRITTEMYFTLENLNGLELIKVSTRRIQKKSKRVLARLGTTTVPTHASDYLHVKFAIQD